MPKQSVPAAGATRSKRAPSNVVRFPPKPKHGRPRGSVDPFTTLARHMAKPNYAAAFLARLIVHHYGEKLQDAVLSALVLLTSPAEWPAHEWPDRVAWFHDWRLAVAGPMCGWPTLAGVKELLRQGRAPGLRKKGNR